MLIDGIRQDLQYAFRQMRHTPALSAVIIGLLAVGVGFNSALYSVMDRLLSRPAPGLGEPDGMVELVRHRYRNQGDRYPGSRLSYPDFLDFRAQQSVFADMAVSRFSRLGVRVQDVTEPVNLYFVSSSYFSVLRVQMELGSGFPRVDDRNPAPRPIAVVSHRFWQRRLSAARGVIGQRIDVNGVPFTIVGVGPPLFNGAELQEDDYDLWLPLSTQRLLAPEAGTALSSRDSTHYDAIARLQPGVSHETASTAATQIARRIEQVYPSQRPYARIEAQVQSMTVIPREDLGLALLLMSWVAGTPVWLLLLVVCANVSSLLLGRAVMRRNEVAVRFSLGASRSRVIRQLLTESILIALLASGAGLLLLFWSVSFFETMFPVELDLPIHWRTVVFTAAFAGGVGVLAGIMPAFHAARTSVFDALKSAAGADPRSVRLQRRFVVAQLTLSLPLLIAASWYMAGAQVTSRAAASFESPANALGVTLMLYMRGYSEPEVDAFLTAARERITSLPGVQGAAFSSAVPFFGSSRYRMFRTPPGEGVQREIAEMRLPESGSIDPEYLKLMRIPILRGRGIEATDHAGAPFVAVVSELYASELWPGQDPLGKHLVARVLKDTTFIETTFTVVGVAGSLAARPGNIEGMRVVYLSRKQLPETRGMILVARTAGPASAVLQSVRRELEALDAQLPLSGLQTFERRIDQSFEIERKVGRFSLAGGLLILLIASVGVYAVIAFTVAQRKREIGIRMALGARAVQVARLFVGQGLRLGLLGLVIGVPVAMILRLAFTQLTYELGATVNTLAVIAVALTLLAVVSLASWLPARRAARVDPSTSLRSE